jgi:adenylate cyclase
MVEKTEYEHKVEELWRTFLTTGDFKDKTILRHIFRVLPGTSRCAICYAPFEGGGSYLTKHLFRKYRSNYNPKLCNTCEDFAKKYRGGVEVELSLLFADVRGSTTLAEKMSPTDFRNLINRFYSVATNVLVNEDAMIDKIIGDQVSGMFLPGFTGPHHAEKALKAAQQLLKETGHENSEGPWIPLGVGIHSGVAFVGSLGTEQGASDVTVLGDVPNTAARLSSSARIGEILISQPAMQAIGLETDNLEQRELQLKGKSESTLVSVLDDYSKLEI